MNFKPFKPHILIINDNPEEVAEIKGWLERDMRVPWSMDHCIDIKEFAPWLSSIDLVILKPQMDGFTSPHEIFQSIENMVFEIPILVLTDPQGEGTLSTYVMENGAADVIVRGQFTRLVDAIEFSLIRQKLQTEARQISDIAIHENQKKHTIDKRRQDMLNDLDQEKNRQTLRMFSGEYSVDSKKR